MFRKHLNHAFIKDLEPINAKIAFIDEQINYLKDKLVNYTGKKNDAHKALNDEVSSRVENLMTEKKVLENDLLTQQNSERIIKEIMKIVDSLPIDEYNPDFRKLFKKVVIKSRTDIAFIVGSDNLAKLDLFNLPKAMTGKYQIKVRAQLYMVDYGIYFNNA